MATKLPMQPIIIDEKGVARFKENALVRYLFDMGGVDLNVLGRIPNIPEEDREQLLQLIGQPVSAYGDVSYVSDESVAEAHRAADVALAAVVSKRRKRDRR